MAREQATVIEARDQVVFEADRIGINVLFANDYFAGVVLGFEPGQSVPAHSHEHKDEVFDVVAGEGEILIGERWLPASPGTVAHIPPGVRHALRNTGDGRWIVRETVRERVYARTALRLLAQALAKRSRLLRRS